MPAIATGGSGPNPPEKAGPIVLRQGYLGKESKHIKKWNVRFFVLTEEEIRFYKHPGAPLKDRRRVKLKEVEKIEAIEKHRLQNVFQLHLRQAQPILLCSGSPEDMLEWILAISAAHTALGRIGGAVDTKVDGSSQVSDTYTSGSSVNGISSITLKPSTRSHLQSVPASVIEAIYAAEVNESERGRLWQEMIGNELNITEELYEALLTRARAIGDYVRHEDKAGVRHKDEKVHAFTVEAEGQEPKSEDTEGAVQADSTFDTTRLVWLKEKNIRLISLDIHRTFAHVQDMQKGGPAEQKLQDVLSAISCHRPDVGYVQGMSYIAGILCLHMTAYEAFVCLANLLNQPILFTFYRFDKPKMDCYFRVYDTLLELHVPSVHSYMKELAFSHDLYMVDWVFTLFTRVLPMASAVKLLDAIFLEGPCFTLVLALAILKLYQGQLMTMEMDEMMRFLHDLPEDVDIRQLLGICRSLGIARHQVDDLALLEQQLNLKALSAQQ